jgi:SAM-dependent methyltransferase
VGVTGQLTRLWLDNARFGWPERARGLHYWLGWEYALLLEHLDVRPDATVVDVGSGAHSIWPHVVARRHQAHVIAIDVHPAIAQQRARSDRAARRGGPGGGGVVSLVQGDVRRLPVADEACDAATAVSAIEHVRGRQGDRQALREIARVLKPGGVVWVTVPFRGAAGSTVELDENLEHFQWHYSLSTLRRSLIAPSGLHEQRLILYGERLPFYSLMRRLPAPLRWLLRPWATLLSARLLRTVQDPADASAAMVQLHKGST